MKGEPPVGGAEGREASVVVQAWSDESPHSSGISMKGGRVGVRVLREEIAMGHF